MSDHVKSVHRLPLLPLGAIVLSASVCTSLPSLAADTLPIVLVPGQVTNHSDDKKSLLTEETQVGKVKQNPHQIPQAITSIPRRLIEDQQAHSLKEALHNVSGLSFNAAEGGRSGDNMMLRGFYTYGDMYLDGMRDTAQYNRETFNLEQIDVLRGTAAMLFGRGQAGGVINQVSKTPLLNNQSKLDTSIGSQQERYVATDLNRQLSDTAAFRINLMTRSQDSWRTNPINGQGPALDRQGVAPSLKWGIGTDQEWTISYYHLKTKDVPDYGIGFGSDKKPNPPFDKYYGVPGNFDNSQTDITTLTNVTKLAPDWTVNTKLRHGEYQRAYWGCAPTSTGGCSSKTRDSSTRNTELQVDVQHDQQLAGLKHEFLFGIEYLIEASDRFSLRNLGSSTQPFYSTVSSGAATTYDGKTFAFYLQDTIHFTPNWMLTLGARQDRLKADYSSLNSPNLTFNENSYRSAISWMPYDTQHYYLSYSDSFSPTADLYQLSGSSSPAERRPGFTCSPLPCH
jgi:catecholate siderophore receptor